MKRWICLCCCLLLCLTAGCREDVPADSKDMSASAPALVRAVWVPYMEVEQWLSAADAVSAIDACMRDCAERGFNTVYVHVRANSDAYYDSAVFTPTATTRALLENGVDPLATAVERAHHYGLSIHAWINPYRIGVDQTRAQTSDIFTFQERWYYVPTAPSTHTLVIDGVREVVERYAVDGVQFDDYFYPVGAVDSQTPADFEAEAYAAYIAAGGGMSVADWRRAAVDRLIAAVCAVCRSRDGCVFGVSPAGDLAQVREQMYADVASWMQTDGYLDYVCPQLYYGFEHQTAPFATLLEEWSGLPRHENIALIVGLALYKTGLPEDPYAGSGKTEWANGGDVVTRQIRLADAAGWNGVALYSHLSFQTDGERDVTVMNEEIEALQAVFAVDNGENS